MQCYFAREIRSVPLHQHFPQFVCSAQYGCCLQFLNFVLSCFVAQVLSGWFWDVSSSPYFYRYRFSFTFHMRWISVMRSLYFKIYSASFLITFLPPGIATSINMHVSCLLSQIMMSGLLLKMVLSVRHYYYYYYYYIRLYVDSFSSSKHAYWKVLLHHSVHQGLHYVTAVR